MTLAILAVAGSLAIAAELPTCTDTFVGAIARLLMPRNSAEPNREDWNNIRTS